jgi:hypothetical protein
VDPLLWLCQENYRTYNVEVARKINSVNAAIYLSELVTRYKYHLNHNELISHPKHGDGWFYYTAEKCEERTCLTVDEQRTSYALLQRHGLISYVKFGVPGKNHFKLHLDKIAEFFSDFSKNNSSCGKIPNWLSENPKLVTGKSQTIYEQYKEPNDEQKEQQQPAAAVAAFSCIKNESRLTKSDVDWLMKFSEQEVEDAINYTKSLDDKGEINTTFSQTVKWAIKTKPKISVPVSIENNKKVSEDLELKFTSNHFRLESHKDYAIIIPLTCQMPPKTLSYDEPNFEDRLVSMLKEMRFKALDLTCKELK